MAYTLDFSIALDPSKAGITDFRAQFINTVGSNVGSPISSGFTEVGTGFYLWHCNMIPDLHRGAVKFYSLAASSTILGLASINPEEAEAVPINLLQTLSSTQTVGTLGDTLKSARGFSKGKWVLDSNTDTLTIYDTDGTTVIVVYDLSPSGGGPWASKVPQ